MGWPLLDRGRHRLAEGAGSGGEPQGALGHLDPAVLLSLDNITFGVVDGVSNGASVWASAGEQALSSALQAGIGLAYSIPALRRRVWLANATVGGAMLVATGSGARGIPRLSRYYLEVITCLLPAALGICKNFLDS